MAVSVSDRLASYRGDAFSFIEIGQRGSLVACCNWMNSGWAGLWPKIGDLVAKSVDHESVFDAKLTDEIDESLHLLLEIVVRQSKSVQQFPNAVTTVDDGKS
jgi:hypothetical protein